MKRYTCKILKALDLSLKGLGSNHMHTDALVADFVTQVLIFEKCWNVIMNLRNGIHAQHSTPPPRLQKLILQLNSIDVSIHYFFFIRTRL